MLVIYTVPVSLYCAKLRVLLRHKSIAWKELSPPGGYGSDEYKRIVPSGNLPALTDGDLTIGDSEAIAEYLNDRFPFPPMLPADAVRRALCRERSRFHDTRLEPELRALFAHIKPIHRDDVFVASQAENLNLRLGQLGTLLEQHMPANDALLTLADCGLPMTCCWIDALAELLDLKIHWPDSLRKERIRLLQYEAVGQELADYQPKINRFIEQATAPSGAP